MHRIFCIEIWCKSEPYRPTDKVSNRVAANLSVESSQEIQPDLIVNRNKNNSPEEIYTHTDLSKQKDFSSRLALWNYGSRQGEI